MNNGKKTGNPRPLKLLLEEPSSKKWKPNNDNENDENDIPVETVRRVMKSISEAEASKKANNFGLPNGSRDQNVKVEKQEGLVELHIIRNSASRLMSKQTSAYMIALQSIFNHQLPEMPLEYITRLLFDPMHKSLVLTKGKQVIGGICFRFFSTQGYVEIVFCAVTQREQVKGFGSYLMSNLKDYVLTKNLKHLLTYADCNAVGFFKKHGFSSRIRLPRYKYVGYIKEYDRATLMHCELHPGIVPTEFTSVVRTQRKILKELISERQNQVQVVQPGLNCFKNGVLSIPIETIPGLKQIGWKPEMLRMDKPETGNPAQLATLFRTVLQSLRRQSCAWPFLEPVKAKDVPDYYEHIKYPMDLKTMGERLDRGYYQTRRLFMADMARIFDNCRTYNASNTEYFLCANQLERHYQLKMRQLGILDK